MAKSQFVDAHSELSPRKFGEGQGRSQLRTERQPTRAILLDVFWLLVAIFARVCIWLATAFVLLRLLLGPVSAGEFPWAWPGAARASVGIVLPWTGAIGPRPLGPRLAWDRSQEFANSCAALLPEGLISNAAVKSVPNRQPIKIHGRFDRSIYENRTWGFVRPDGSSVVCLPHFLAQIVVGKPLFTHVKQSGCSAHFYDGAKPEGFKMTPNFACWSMTDIGPLQGSVESRPKEGDVTNNQTGAVVNDPCSIGFDCGIARIPHAYRYGDKAEKARYYTNSSNAIKLIRCFHKGLGGDNLFSSGLPLYYFICFCCLPVLIGFIGLFLKNSQRRFGAFYFALLGLSGYAFFLALMYGELWSFDCHLAPPDSLTENIRVQPIVVPELEFRDVQRQIFA